MNDDMDRPPSYAQLYGSIEVPAEEYRRKMSKDGIVASLFVLLGISSWAAVNGVWVELPVLVQRLPEGWLLSSHLVALIQLANLGPLAYTALRRALSNKDIEVPAIHTILLVGCLSTAILPHVWSKSTTILGHEHSVAFLVLAFTLALVDCTSSVLYFPFMASFREGYLLPMMVGEGLSGLLPGLVALAQGVGGNPTCINTTQADGSSKLVPVSSEPRFSVEVFFYVLLGLLVCSWIAFVLLRTLPRAIAAMVPGGPENLSDSAQPLKSSTDFNDVNFRGRKALIALLCLQAFICCLSNGVLPAIQTFSALPYGNLAYHFAVTLASIANPTACFITMVRPAVSFRTLGILLGVALVAAGYVLTTAVLSPTPPLVGVTMGSILVVAAWVTFSGLSAYLRASIATILRSVGGHRALFRYGAVMQLGSCVGAITIFLVVNYTSVFHAYRPC